MRALNVVVMQGGFDVVLSLHEMSTGVQYVAGAVSPNVRPSGGLGAQMLFRGLVLWSRFVLPIADADFVFQYQQAYGRPLFNTSGTTAQVACIIGQNTRGLDVAWDAGMTEELVELAGSRQPQSITGDDQRTAFLAAMATAFPVIPAIPPPGTPRPVVAQVNGDEGFLRFSWSTPDRRVDTTTGTVLAGTYTAPYRDGVKVSSGLEAVARLALPVPLPARYTIMLTPPAGTVVEVGAVAPAYGQAGGGVEAMFPNQFINQNLHYHRLPDY